MIKRKYKHVALALCIALFVFAAFTAVASAENLDEGFESGSIPGSWRVIDNDGDDELWEAVDEWPDAHEGDYVAEVHWNSDGNDDWLITPKLSPDAGNNTISFWYRSEDEEEGLLEDFNVKLSTTGTDISDFTVTLDSITDAPASWTHYTKDLSAYIGDDIHIAVQCVSVDEYYLWVDDFTGPPIASVPKSLSSLTVNQASTGSVGTGSNDNPILRLDFDVTGNTGTLTLNSIEVEPQNTDNSDVAASGVKLYRTTTTTFSADNQLGTAQGFSSPANFSSLSYNLPEGMTYVWVTYDVASDATSGNTLDAKILAGKVDVNGSTYPAGDRNPAGSREILILDYKEIGTGTGDEKYVPFYGFYDYGWSKIIYTQSEIGEAITIDKIAFDVSNDPSSYTTDDQRIYMAHTTDSTFADGSKPDPSTMNEVYTGSITWDGSGWHEITLGTSFTYTNADNLLIYYENRDGSYKYGYPIWHYTSKSNRAAYKYADNTFPTGSGTVSDKVPNVRLFYGAAGPSPKTLSSLTGAQASTDCVIPGSTNNPILRLDFEVTGTDGTLNLTEIKVTSNNTDDADITASGVKAYRTSTPTFSTEHQFGSGASFASAATIAGNYDLPTGTTYLWITYDIASGAAPGNITDAKVTANNITVGGSTNPSSAIDPAGNRPVCKDIYVPDDYGTIQDAINASSPGDTIIVRDDMYTENVIVNKRYPLQIEG